MKVAVITDSHFGTRSDSLIFLDKQEKFFNEVFFPKLDEIGAKVILDLGDTFDRRKYINFVTLSRVKSFFFAEIAKRNIEYHAIVGNHTVYFRNTNEINSMDLLLGEYPNFHLYTHEPVELTFDSMKLIMVPWLTKENEEQALKAIKKTKANILGGHLDIKGFEMMRGRVADQGLDRKLFSKFDRVWSGHYHHPSSHDNIEYLGAPYEMNWSDAGGLRGFHIYDTENKTLERILNPFQMFHKLNYEDSDLTIDELNALDTSPLKDTYVKVVVNNKTNPYLFDLFIARLQDAAPVDIKIIEDTLNLENITEEDIVTEAKDTRELLWEYVDSIETTVPKKKVKNLITSLYTEAINL